MGRRVIAKRRRRITKCTVGGIAHDGEVVQPLALWGRKTVGYQPNRLILEGSHRLVVESFARTPGRTLLLRPARKRLFDLEPAAPSLAVELNKPAFGVLVNDDDPEAKPVLIIETDSISAGIRDLYRNADLPYVEVEQVAGRGSFRFERPGFSAKLQFDDRGDSQAIESVVRWSETACPKMKGSLVRNSIENRVASAIRSFCGELGVCIHHQVPFGYAVGYRSDLPRTIARHTIEMSVTLRPELDPSMSVVLPIRIDASAAEAQDTERIERDQSIAEYVCSVGMPMAAIQPGTTDSYRLTYSLGDNEELEMSLDDVEGWERTLKAITEHAVTETRRTLSGA